MTKQKISSGEKKKWYQFFLNKFNAFMILSGIALFTVTFFKTVDNDKRHARLALDDAITYLEGQCGSYKEIVNSDRMKSLFRLTDKALELGWDLERDRDLLEQQDTYLKQYGEHQRLTGIVILDQNLKPVQEYHADSSKNKDWMELVQSDRIRSIAEYPSKVYAGRMEKAGNVYDVAAVARLDEEGIIFCYLQQNLAVLEANQNSLENLLLGYNMEMDGTLFITDDSNVLGTNETTLQNSSISKIPSIQDMEQKVNGRNLTKFRSEGRVFYGGRAGCGQYHVYVYYPCSKVFESTKYNMLHVMGLYLLCWLFVAVMRYRSERQYADSLKKQLDIIHAISKVYTVCLTIDLASNELEIIKAPDYIARVLGGNGDAFEKLNRMADSYIMEQYVEPYKEFTSPPSIRKKLTGQEYTDMIFKDRKGIWYQSVLIEKNRTEEEIPKSVIMVIRNVQDYKEKETEYQNKLIQAVQEAEHANIAKTDFLRRMSHDIRTPINGIRGMVEMANRYPEDAKVQKESREKIWQSSGFLLDLVNNVLDMNKLESGVITLQQVPFNMSEVLSSIVGMVDQQAQSHGIHLHLHMEERIHKNLIGSPLHLRQILMNILSNAVKYNRPGGNIDFYMKEVPRDENTTSFTFKCKDSGIGISNEFKQYIFEPFAQENTGAVMGYRGTGLGLPIVKKLVDKMEGSISFESSKGFGSTFVITLPFLVDHQAEQNIEKDVTAISYEEPCLTHRKILLVEDNELNMEIVESLLHHEGAAVSKAWNGKEAVELFEQSKVGEFHGILMDIMMPAMNGMDATKQIRAMEREDAKTIPIIAMTANAFTDDVENCRKAGMNEHLAKPLDTDRMIALLVQLTSKAVSDVSAKTDES